MDRDVCSEVIFGRSVRTYMCENEDICGRKERKGEAKLTPNYNRLRFFSFAIAPRPHRRSLPPLSHPKPQPKYDV